MSLQTGTAIGGFAILFALLVLAPLILYHFLVAPNVVGFFNDLSWYNHDSESDHFLYWFWFWGIAFGGFYSAFKLNKSG